MGKATYRTEAEHLLRVAATHPEFRGGEIIVSKGVAAIAVDLNVEMPLHMKADGVSTSGVRTIERAIFRFPDRYPWMAPGVTLREDFPRAFPHLLPSRRSEPPRPCLLEGDIDEFFMQFGLVEYGIFHLIEQLACWLRRAAVGTLIDPQQGWQPMMRQGLDNFIEFDADRIRGLTQRSGGFAVLRSHFLRRGGTLDRVTEDTKTWTSCDGEAALLSRETLKSIFTGPPIVNERCTGGSVTALLWVEDPGEGNPSVSDIYWPEDVRTIGELRARAEALGCKVGLERFLEIIHAAFEGSYCSSPIPIAIVLCIRRPFNLIGSTSPIELLPYVIEIRPTKGRDKLFAFGDDEPVAPALHYEALTPALLRTLGETPVRASAAVLGCGSVGSKLAFHFARSGQEIVAVSDKGIMLPHNMARHALCAGHIPHHKADAVAGELRQLGQKTESFVGDIAAGLCKGAHRDKILPPSSSAIINATGSLSVREALVENIFTRPGSRAFEAALFGRGKIAYVLADGEDHNPDHCDLMAELYATADHDVSELLAAPSEGLANISVGQGCGTVTMPMDDAQLSMMTAGLAKQIGRSLDAPKSTGAIIVGVSNESDSSVRWTRTEVDPFQSVAIEGSDGWTLRLSSTVAARIRTEARAYGSLETGGVMIGLSSARRRTVTVVDLLDAPPDSKRTASHFLLGIENLQDQIRRRHAESGDTLFDVGTWHSHLAEQGPSETDWTTAAKLAAERTPPSVLLITTPTTFHALIAKRKS